MLSSRCLKETFNILSCWRSLYTLLKQIEFKTGAGGRVCSEFPCEAGALEPGVPMKGPEAFIVMAPVWEQLRQPPIQWVSEERPQHGWPLSIYQSDSLISLKHLSESLRSLPPPKPLTIASSLFIRHFEGQPGLHLLLKGSPSRF